MNWGYVIELHLTFGDGESAETVVKTYEGTERNSPTGQAANALWFYQQGWSGVAGGKPITHWAKWKVSRELVATSEE